MIRHKLQARASGGDFFPAGTSQQDVANYIDETLRILEKTKGSQYPLNGEALVVELRNGLKVKIGSDLGDKIENAQFPPNDRIIGHFSPVKGGITVTIGKDLKLINQILQ